MYKINLHAHTIFSDGVNTPLGMAMVAKELGFTALVITDHCHIPHPERKDWQMDIRKMKLLKRAADEAKRFMPTIVGIELAFGGEEMLVFGSAMIQAILRHYENGAFLNIDMLLRWKREHDSAFILCHPQHHDNWAVLRPLLDGYELYNSGQHMFDDRELGALSGLQAWCNSDAHNASMLNLCYNFVDTKIETESDLIRYIKRGNQPAFMLPESPAKLR